MVDMEQKNKRQVSTGRQTLYCLTAVIILASACYSVSDWLGYRVVALLMLLLVSTIAVLSSILPVLITAAVSAFIWDFFFIPPRFNLQVTNAEDLMLLIMYFVIALINGVLTYKIRQAEKLSRIREEKANSVQLYNTILDSLSHELRTPIATIIGATDNLQTNKNLQDKDREGLVDEISQASLRLNQQIENLLNLSRLESGHIAPRMDWVDVSELVYEVVGRVEANAHRRRVTISIRPGMPLVLTDKGMLEQVLYNLLNNAAIHTPSASAISITAACYENLLQLIIEDNGPGFGREAAKTVFQKFARDHRSSTSGSGLGLSIVKGFTDALGGDVQLEDNRGAGARFVVSMPVKTTPL